MELITPPASPRRNAITSMSVTPFILKTASVPTSVKLRQAAPLNEDLQNELAGATIEEEQIWTGNNHFVHYFFQSFQSFQEADVQLPALSELKDGETPLYDVNLNCWQPIYLPYILRSSSLHLQSTSRDKKKKKPNQTSATGRTSRRAKGSVREVTYTRTVQDPNMKMVTETEQITYMPKPGSEEEKVAGWLNLISAALRRLAPPALRMNTRSNTRLLADAERHWSAEFSTQPAPMDSTDMKMKPDVALLRKDPFDPTRPNSWRNIVSFLELSSDSNPSRQVIRKCYAIFAAQPGRRFVTALSISQQQFRFYLFDRAGAVQSRTYPIHTGAQYLIRVLYTLTLAPDELLGYDPTLRYSSIIPRTVQPRLDPTIRVDNKTYTITRLLFSSDMIRGRATVCFAVTAGSKQSVVKISWTRNGRATTEEQMLNRIKERGLTHGVPALVKAWTVRIGGKDDSTESRRPEYLRASLGGEFGGEQPEIRIHRRLVLEPVGMPLETFGSIQELISIIIDIVDVHESLVNRCGILHRDLSIKNMMNFIFNYKSHQWPIQSGDENIRARLSEREEVLRERKYRRGLLIDYDYAKFTDEASTMSEGHRTGTIPFMALDILDLFGSDTAPDFTHQPKHDLESIIYVLIWTCVLYTGPNVEPLPAHTTCLRQWAECKSRAEVEALWSLKMGELTTLVPLRHFTPYFQSLKPLGEQLYGAIVRDRMKISPLTYDVLRGILLDAFFEADSEEPSIPAQPGDRVRANLQKNVVCTKPTKNAPKQSLRP